MQITNKYERNILDKKKKRKTEYTQSKFNFNEEESFDSKKILKEINSNGTNSIENDDELNVITY